MSSQSNRSTEDLIRKSLHAGHVYQLTHAKKESESSLRNWFENFLSLFEVEEQTIIQKFQYLWRRGDILKAQSTLLFPSNREQLAELFTQSRLAKDMFDPPLTDAEVTVLTETNGVALDYAIKAEGTNPVCITCHNDCVGTCVGHRLVFDRVIKHVTNGMYANTPAAFTEASTVRKALAKFQNTAKRFILPELADAFTNGKYINWQSLTNSIRRAFNVREERQTLSNLFSRIHVAASSAINMENKIDSLSNIAMEIAITDKNDFFRPKDFDGDLSQTMSAPEQYGPLVNTLLTYIVMRETVPMAKWEHVQTDFERRIQSGWSYRSWHENRPQLYDIVDKVKTVARRVGAVGVNHNDANMNEVDDDASVDDNESNIDPDYPIPSSYGGQNRHFESNRNERNHFQPSMTQEYRRVMNSQAPRRRSCLCLHCSHYHPQRLTVYHPEGSGFGGEGKYCLFDAEGKERNDVRGRDIHAIGGELKFIDADGVYPIMADVEMYDQLKGINMTSCGGPDNLHSRKKELARTPTANILSVQEGKVCEAAPNIMANFGTNGTADCYGTINFDSGAVVSYIHASMIGKSDFVKSGPRKREFYGAGGNHLKLEPFVIDIKVNVGNRGVYEFKNVLVGTSGEPSDTMLVGQLDLERLGIDISFARRTVTFGQGALKGVPLPMEQKFACSINPIKSTQWKRSSEVMRQYPKCLVEVEVSDFNVADTGVADADGVRDCCIDLGRRKKKEHRPVRPSKRSNGIFDPKTIVQTCPVNDTVGGKFSRLHGDHLRKGLNEQHVSASTLLETTCESKTEKMKTSKSLKQHNQRPITERKKRFVEPKANRRMTPTELLVTTQSKLNSELKNKQFTTMFKVGDCIQLNVGEEKTDSSTTWVVRIIDSSKKRVLLKRVTGLATGRRERRWMTFEEVKKLSPKESSIPKSNRLIKTASESTGPKRNQDSSNRNKSRISNLDIKQTANQKKKSGKN